MRNSKQLVFQHSSYHAVRLRTEFLAYYTGRALVQPTPDHRERIQQHLRSLFDSVYKLVPNVPDSVYEFVPNEDDNDIDEQDNVNLSNREWKSVPLFLRQLQFDRPMPLRACNMFTAEFRAPIGEEDVEPHLRRAQHIVRVFLPIYMNSPTDNSVALVIEYHGFLRFKKFDEPDGPGQLKLITEP